MDDVWWRFSGLPTSGEWQAFWAMLGVLAALALLYVAWKQLSGLARSNHELTRSNELLAESNKNLSRPYVVVEFEFRVASLRSYQNSSGSSTIFVVIKDAGQTSARDVNLYVDPPFETASEDVKKKAHAFLQERFSGSSPIRMLTPGQKLTYALDGAGAAVGNDELPAEYRVHATYSDVSGKEVFDEDYVLQMSPWALSVADQDPLNRISKDIQFLSETLRSNSHGLPKVSSAVRSLGLNEDAP